MAFLCPSRRSRQKKKKKEEKEPYLGRITGSSSVDTLVRVGLEKQHGLSPEARMTVVDRFSAGADDELNVDRGQTVYMLYTEEEWMYVLTDAGREGFIPRSFAKPCRSPALSKRVPPTPLSQVRGGILSPVGGTDDEGNDGDESNSPTNSSSQVAGFPDASLADDDLQPLSPASDDPQQPASPASEDLPPSSLQSTEQEGDASGDTDLPDILPFEKRAQGKWVAMFSYDVEQESDVKVTSGEVVTLMNAADKDWYWIRRSGGAEGFVPSTHLCKLPEDFRINNHMMPASSASPMVHLKWNSPGHRRSVSMTDQPASLPSYLRPPLYRPLSSTATSPADSGHPAAAFSASRPPMSSGGRQQRPHSSMGNALASHGGRNQGAAPLSASTTTTNQQPPAASQHLPPRPHSAMGYPFMASSSSSSSPGYGLGTASPAASSSGFPASSQQRPHSSMGQPVGWSPDPVPGGPGPPSSHPASRSLPSSPENPLPPSHAGSSPSPLRDNRTVNPLSPPGQGYSSPYRPPPLANGPAFHHHSSSSRLTSPTSPTHSPPHTATHALPPPYPTNHHSPPATVKGKPPFPSASNPNPPPITADDQLPPPYPPNNHSHPGSATAKSPVPSPSSPNPPAIPADSRLPPPYPANQHSPTVSSTGKPHLSTSNPNPSLITTDDRLPPPYPTNHHSPPATATKKPQFSTTNPHPHPHPNSSSITKNNRFISARSQESDPHRLSSSLNQSQNGRRTPLVVHRNSAPDLTEHQSQGPANPTPQTPLSPGPYNPSHSQSSGPHGPSHSQSSGTYNPSHNQSSGPPYNPPHSQSSGLFNPSHSQSSGPYNPPNSQSSGPPYNPSHSQSPLSPGSYPSRQDQSQRSQGNLPPRGKSPLLPPGPYLSQTQSPVPPGPHTSHGPYASKDEADARWGVPLQPGSNRPPSRGASDPRARSSTQQQQQQQHPQQPPSSSLGTAAAGNVTELVTLHRFTGQGDGDISVLSDELVYGDLSKQPERDWLWVYSPRLDRHGYVPRDNVTVHAAAAANVSQAGGNRNVARV